MASSEGVFPVTEQPGFDAERASTQIVYIGLGKMGVRMAGKLVDEGHTVVGFDVSEDARLQASEAGITVFDDLEGAVGAGGEPGERLILSMLPAKITEHSLLDVSSRLSEGDIVIDGGNSHFRDTENRA